VKLILRLLGWLSLTLGLLLCLLGVASLPPDGLVFALPIVFLMPGVSLAVGGGLLLFLAREKAWTPTRTNNAI
jgi:hypothetical protein